MILSARIKALLADETSSGGQPSRSDGPPAARRSLLADESGATMVMGIFMAAMLVGMIYYVWGIGGMVIHRERLQDAADTAAFGAAVINARGMNLISILNVIMLVLAIIGTAMLIVPWILAAAAGAAASDCRTLQPCVYCICCPACAAAITHGADAAIARSDATRMRDRINNALRAMNTAAHAISRGAPQMGQALAVAYGTSVYRPTTDFGFALVSPFGTLEIEDDRDYVCQLVPSPLESTHNVLSAPAIFAAGTAAATYVFARRANHVPLLIWFNRYYVASYAAGWAVHYDDFCNGRSFLRVKRESWLGEEAFQSRTVMHGAPPFAWTVQGVAVANWGRTAGTESVLAAIPPDVANSIGIAQAEYYWESREGDIREEWLFAPRWRARLRRFSVSSAVSGMPYVGSIARVIDGTIIH